MVIIGLGCKAQVGKDTAAEYIENKFPGKAKRLAFADKLKQIAMDLFGLTYEQCYGSKEVKETVDPRYGLSPREIMQKLGEKMREIHPSIWVDTVFNSTLPKLKEEGYECFVISDVRYPNEGDQVHAHGGVVVRVDRDAGGTSVGSNHPSETSMNDYKEFDFILKNNSSLEDYLTQIEELLEDVNYYGGTKRVNQRRR
jgi:hypothetical protein